MGSPIVAETKPAEGFGFALKAITTDSAVYFAGSAMLGLGNFVLVPLYTRTLSPALFGIYSLLDITILVLVAVSLMKLDVSYLREFVSTPDEERAKLINSVSLVVTCTSALLGGLLAISVWAPTGKLMFGTSDVSFWWTLLPIVVLEALQTILLSDLRVRRRAVAFCASTILRLLVMAVASYWLLAVRHYGVWGLFVGRLVGDFAGVVLPTLLIVRSSFIGVDWGRVRPMLDFGLPLVWGTAMMLSLDASGRFFLVRYGSLEQVGLYGAAIKISGVFQMLVTQPFGIAWGGIMFRIKEWPNARLVYSKLLLYVFVVGAGTSLAIAFATPLLFKVLASPEYYQAMWIFPALVIVRALNMLEYPSSISLYLAGKTGRLSAIYTLGVISTIIANVLLVPLYGLKGTVTAMVVSWVLILITLRIVGEQYYRLHYSFGIMLVSALPWLVYFVFQRTFISMQAITPQVLLSLATLLLTALLILVDFRRVRLTTSVSSLTPEPTSKGAF